MSELGDIADRAARREAEFLEAALQRQRRASASPQQSAIECQHCGSAKCHTAKGWTCSGAVPS